MQHDFWHQRWQDNQIGFHLADANPLLVKHFFTLNLKSGARVFLPLCGKTLDIAWLLENGYRVVGAELSVIAIEALFEQLNLTPQLTTLNTITRYSAANIDIFVGDFFNIAADDLGMIDAVYDRAALVALPEALRKPYAAHLITLTKNAPQLLICFDYDQALLAGPPFCVNAQEIRLHYQQHYQLSLLDSVAVEGGLKGQCAAIEQVWWLN